MDGDSGWEESLPTAGNRLKKGQLALGILVILSALPGGARPLVDPGRTAQRSVRKKDLGWAMVSITGNTFGFFGGIALAATNPVIGVIVAGKSVYGALMGGLNVAAAILEVEPESTGACFNDAAKAIFPRSMDAQAAAAVLDLAIDLRAIASSRQVSTVLRMGLRMDPLLGSFVASNKIGYFARFSNFGPRAEVQLQVLAGTQATKTYLEIDSAVRARRSRAPLEAPRRLRPIPRAMPLAPMRATVTQTAAVARPAQAHLPLVPTFEPMTATVERPMTAHAEPPASQVPAGPGCPTGYRRDPTDKQCYPRDTFGGSGGSHAPTGAPRPTMWEPGVDVRSR